MVAYAPSMYDDNMSKAADDYAYELAVSIVDDEFIVTAEGYEYQGVADSFKDSQRYKVLYYQETTGI